MRFYAVILGTLLIIGGYFKNDFLLTIFSHHNPLQDLFGKKVFSVIKESIDSGLEVDSQLSARLSADEVGRAISLKIKRRMFSKNDASVVLELISVLRSSAETNAALDINELLEKKRNNDK